jgi:hypothetical protein
MGEPQSVLILAAFDRTRGGGAGKEGLESGDRERRVQRAIRTIADLGEEKFRKIVNEMIRGTPAQMVTRLIQQEWGDAQDVGEDMLEIETNHGENIATSRPLAKSHDTRHERVALCSPGGHPHEARRKDATSVHKPATESEGVEATHSAQTRPGPANSLFEQGVSGEAGDIFAIIAKTRFVDKLITRRQSPHALPNDKSI